MEISPFSLTEDQKRYLQYLRDGTIDDLVFHLRNKLTADSRADFANIRQFLNAQGHPEPQPRDLYLTVKRQDLLRLLDYAEANNSLGIQYCFSYDRYVEEGGQIQLINKATMWKRNNDTSDEEVFFADFKRIDEHKREYSDRFLNFNPSFLISDEKAGRYVENFLHIYPGRSLVHKPFLNGSLLPVRPLKKIFTDPGHPLGITDTLTFRCGLTNYSLNGELGNFTLVIGVGDVTTGPVIEFRTEVFKIISPGDCPPRPPCR